MSAKEILSCDVLEGAGAEAVFVEIAATEIIALSHHGIPELFSLGHTTRLGLAGVEIEFY